MIKNSNSKQYSVEININQQQMWLKEGDETVKSYRVSTAKNGPGETMDSECTPRGKHEIFAKIGDGSPPNEVFVGRQPTGEIYSEKLREQCPDRDWILTRILWLTGQEPGKNRGEQVDSRQRYIYIHGTPDDVAMGVPGSRGCVRMRNADIIEFFDLVETGTPVVIDDI